jgi:hypothetical protein
MSPDNKIEFGISYKKVIILKALQKTLNKAQKSTINTTRARSLVVERCSYKGTLQAKH